MWEEHFRYEENNPTQDQKYLARVALEVIRKFHDDPAKVQLDNLFLKDEYKIPDNEVERHKRTIRRERRERLKRAAEQKGPVELTEAQKQSQQVWKAAIGAVSKNKKGRRDGPRSRRI